MNSNDNRTRSTTKRAWLNVSGRWQFFRGRSCHSFDLSYEKFHRLLDLNPHSFTAHFYLGQIARERGQARLAFDHYLAAYRSSVTAFNRSKLPDDLKNHIALRHGLSRSKRVVFHELGQQTGPSIIRAEFEAIDHTGFGRHPEFEIHLPQNQEIGVTDFSSTEEAQKFEDRAPISQEELESVDLEVLISQLMAE
ncbi:MAG: hypothetical protein ACI97A_000330 [Planctomycetota bacterium]|jgi:hypothetical protein